MKQSSSAKFMKTFNVNSVSIIVLILLLVKMDFRPKWFQPSLISVNILFLLYV